MERNIHNVHVETSTRYQLRLNEKGRVLSQIKDETTRQFVQEFIPDNKPIDVYSNPPIDNTIPPIDNTIVPSSQINNKFKSKLSILVDSLGQNTHLVLFGLAATAKNPQELANIFTVLSHLDITDNYEVLAKSEDRFVKRRLSESIEVDLLALDCVNRILYKSKDLQTDKRKAGILQYFHISPSDPLFRDNYCYLLESFFYIMSTKKIPIREKKRVLQQLYDLKKQFYQNALGIDGHYGMTIFDRHTTFWNYVNVPLLSINLDYSTFTTSRQKPDQPKKINIPDSKQPITEDGSGPLKALLEIQQEKNASLRATVTDLQNQLRNSQSQVDALKRETQQAEQLRSILEMERRKHYVLIEDNRRLQDQLRTSEDETDRFIQLVEQLKKRLDELTRQGKPSERSPFEVLGVNPTATPEEITRAYKNIFLTIHPDRVEGHLKNTQLTPQAIVEIKNLLNGRMQDVNAAIDQLRRMGKIK